MVRISTGEVADVIQWVTPSVQVNTWVRILKEGLFCHEVGLVDRREVNGGLRRLRVLLVPRLPAQLGDKRKPSRAPHALLYDSENHLFTGRRDKHEYESGLLVVWFGDGQVTHQDVSMTDEARYWFNRSDHPLLLRCPIPASESWVFELDEPVFSVRSETEKEGIVKSVEAQRCLVAYEDIADEYVLKRNLRKRFRSFDTVQVTHGTHKHEHGVIVAVYWETCQIALLRQDKATEVYTFF
jgi:transcription elongation factor